MSDEIQSLKNMISEVLNNDTSINHNIKKEFETVLNNDYSTVCDLKKKIKFLLDKYRYFQYVEVESVSDVGNTKGTYFFDSEKDYLYINPESTSKTIRVYSDTVSYMALNDDSEEDEAFTDVYMTTKKYYNSCVYDIYCDYDNFPTNLTKPQNSDVVNIFSRSMPITKLPVLNVVLSFESKTQEPLLSDSFSYKIGDYIVSSATKYSNYYLDLTDLAINDDGDMTATYDTSTTIYYSVTLDDAGNLYLIEEDKGVLADNLAFDEETGDLTVNI